MVKSLKILILIHPELNPLKVGLVKSKHVDSPCKAESFLYSTLKKMGHLPEFLELDENIDPLVERVNQSKVDVVFNFLEELSGEAKFDFHAISYLESKGVCFTGNGPRALMLTRDKQLSKAVVKSLDVKTPSSYLITKEKDLESVSLNFPMFVKFNTEDASLGLSQSNRVESKAELTRAFRKLRELSTQPILIEEFVAGMDVCVGVLGNQKPTIFPARVLKLPSSDWVAGETVKFTSRHRLENKIRSQKLIWKSKKESSFFEREALRIYTALGMRGYGRIDFRRTPSNEFYFLEANSNPDLSRDEDFAVSAKSAGLSYERLLHAILKFALEAKKGRRP